MRQFDNHELKCQQRGSAARTVGPFQDPPGSASGSDGRLRGVEEDAMQRASEGGATQASGSASCHGVSEVELEPEDETYFENQINDTTVEMSPLFLQGFLQAVVQAMLRDARNRIEPRVDIEYRTVAMRELANSPGSARDFFQQFLKSGTACSC